ncbi:hypothetical protein Tco_0576969 [Tanacetum coccineum]
MFNEAGRFLRLWKIWKNASAEILRCFYLSMMTKDINEEVDAEEFTFVLTDEWKEFFFAKYEAKRRLGDNIYDSRLAASKKYGYTLGEPSMYERKTDKLVGHDNFDTNAISDKPVVVELWLVDT